MRILDRYSLREFTWPFLGCVAGFTVILISGVLFELTDLIIRKKVAWTLVLRMLGYRLPQVVVIALPLGVLFGILLALGRLAKDSELTVIRCAGVSFRRLSVPLLLVALAVSLLTFVANERIVPWGNHHFENAWRRLVFQDPLPAVREKVFFRDARGTVFYVGEVDSRARRLRDVMIYEIGEDGGFPRMITARAGTYGERVWNLHEVVTRTIAPDGFVQEEVFSAAVDYPLSDRMDGFFGNQKTTDEMNRAELGRHIQLFQRSGINVAPFLVEYHLKLALPFASLVFALLAAPLCTRAAKSGWAFGLVSSVGVLVLYYVVTAVFRSLGMNGVVPPLPAAWLPTVLFAAAGAYLIYRTDLAGHA